ncbi:uncharacterized protein LOC134753798 [Cydia strobilella]|uniref:uncharacterized protein LOC134753798 n=1 Tax=Cydia strobilella TaxID=1100964 RepID=UPI0030062350
MSCSVPDCSEKRSRNPKKYSFHRFPTDPELRREWLRAITRETLTPANSSLVCGKHFVPECFLPTAKRKILKRGSIPTLFLPASEPESNSPIINFLNADCRRRILDYLPVRDLMRMERTCKLWQNSVLDHISQRRILIRIYKDFKEAVRIVPGGFNPAKAPDKFFVTKDNDEVLTIFMEQSVDWWLSFKLWLKKFGPAVRKFDANCQYFEDVVEILRYTCPNLEVLRLINLQKKLSHTSTLYFPKLARLAFQDCGKITDGCVNQFLTSDMNELCLSLPAGEHKHVKGRYLHNLNIDKMKCLTLSCLISAAHFSILLSYADRLKNLTTLVLDTTLERGVNNRLHMLLDRMPNLEEFSFLVYGVPNNDNDDQLRQRSNVFFESVCRLKKLRRFKADGVDVWDEHLEALAMNCKDLLAVRSPCNRITKVGLAALCRELGPQLRELNLTGSRLDDDSIAACVYACPKLVWLNISDHTIFNIVVDRIAEARRDMRANLRGSMYASDNENNLRFKLQLRIDHLRSWSRFRMPQLYRYPRWSEALNIFEHQKIRQFKVF